MPKVYVGVASNMHRELSIRAGTRLLMQRFGPLAVSPVYESSACGVTAPAFYNFVVSFSTELEPRELKLALRSIEAECGRVRGPLVGTSRTLDLDLLLYGDRTVDVAINLPHDEIEKYPFVLRPLADLSGSSLHPQTGLSFNEMWSRFDRSEHPIWRVPFDPEDTNGVSG